MENQTESLKKQLKCFKELTPEERIKKMAEEAEAVGKIEKKHSNNLRKLREIEKETKRVQAEMIDKGAARLKKMTDMDALELRALSLTKIEERRLTRNFYKGVPSSLINDERVCPGAKAVFALLQSRITEKKMKYYPKVAIAVLTIAKRMGVTYDTATKYVKELREFGWVDVERRGRQVTNRYILYGIKNPDFNIMVKMKEIDLKIVRDYELKNKLTPSLEK